MKMYRVLLSMLLFVASIHTMDDKKPTLTDETSKSSSTSTLKEACTQEAGSTDEKMDKIRGFKITSSDDYAPSDDPVVTTIIGQPEAGPDPSKLPFN